jgi:hypothetical protein
MGIRKIIREEIESDWDFMDDIEISYKNMTKDLLDEMLNNNDKTAIYWNDDGSEYYISLNNGKCGQTTAPIIVSWGINAGVARQDEFFPPAGCTGYTYESMLDQFKNGYWTLEKPQ